MNLQAVQFLGTKKDAQILMLLGSKSGFCYAIGESWWNAQPVSLEDMKTAFSEGKGLIGNPSDPLDKGTRLRKILNKVYKKSVKRHLTLPKD